MVAPKQQSRPQTRHPFLKKKFQVGSANGRVDYEVSERVFHHSETPQRAIDKRKETESSIKSAVLAQVDPDWNKSTTSGANHKGGARASWDDDGWENHFYNAVEREDRIQKLHERRELLKRGDDRVAWNFSTVSAQEMVPSLRAAPSAEEMHRLNQTMSKTRRAATAPLYRSPVERHNETVELQRTAKRESRKPTVDDEYMATMKSWQDYPDDPLTFPRSKPNYALIASEIQIKYPAELLQKYLQENGAPSTAAPVSAH